MRSKELVLLIRVALARVVGGKYPSLPPCSEGVGEGEMTRGVGGIGPGAELIVPRRMVADAEGPENAISDALLPGG